MLYMILYTIDIKEKSDKEIQYSKLSYGRVGHVYFQPFAGGRVTKILCHYEGVGHLFF